MRIANSSKYQSSQTTHVCNNALQYPTEKEENLYNNNTGISVDHSFTHRTDSKDRKFEICALMTQYTMYEQMTVSQHNQIVKRDILKI